MSDAAPAGLICPLSASHCSMRGRQADAKNGCCLLCNSRLNIKGRGRLCCHFLAIWEPTKTVTLLKYEVPPALALPWPCFGPALALHGSADGTFFLIEAAENLCHEDPEGLTNGRSRTNLVRVCVVFVIFFSAPPQLPRQLEVLRKMSTMTFSVREVVACGRGVNLGNKVDSSSSVRAISAQTSPESHAMQAKFPAELS